MTCSDLFYKVGLECRALGPEVRFPACGLLVVGPISSYGQIDDSGAGLSPVYPLCVCVNLDTQWYVGSEVLKFHVTGCIFLCSFPVSSLLVYSSCVPEMTVDLPYIS